MATETNPANAPGADTAARKRVPMSIPTRRLEVPELPGYHLHWFLDRNVPRALQGGYEMVSVDELPVNQKGVGTDSQISGSSDLGSHIRIVDGVATDGKVQYLNLMKIREEWFREDQRALEERNASVLGAIFRDEQILGAEKEKAEDRKQFYVDRERTNLQTKPLLQRPTRKGK